MTRYCPKILSPPNAEFIRGLFPAGICAFLFLFYSGKHFIEIGTVAETHELCGKVTILRTALFAEGSEFFSAKANRLPSARRVLFMSGIS